MVNDPSREERIATLRRATMRLVLGIVALHGTALAIYFGAGIAHRSPTLHNEFVIVWMIATAILVAFLLRKVRQARFVPPRR